MPPHHPALACTGFRLARLPSRVTIWLLRKGPHWRVYVSLFRPNGISGSQDIIVTQRQIFKYRNHPKTTKGANLPVEDYGIIEATLKNPTNIFEDTVQKHLVYVYTHPYYGDRLAKVVVEPNYRSRGTVIDLLRQVVSRLRGTSDKLHCQVTPEQRWTQQEAVKMEKDLVREKRLHIQSFGMPEYRKDEVEEMLAAQVAVSI